MSSSEPPKGLDPDRAAQLARERAAAPPGTGGRTAPDGPGEQPGPSGDPGEQPERLPAQPIDTRRYQRMVGGFGLLLVIAFSVYLYAGSGTKGSPGIAAGKRIHRFVAPLATSDLNVPANAHPRCNPAHPARRGLNVCGRGPLVLAFFVPSAAACVNEVDTLQTVSHRFRGLQFAAVAVGAGRRTTDALVRRHGWTIPVAYDLTGTIGQVYGVEVCPIIELVRPGGIVQQRLIGESWRQPAALAARVARLAAVSHG